MTKWLYFKWLMYYRNGRYIEAIKMLRKEIGIGLKDAHSLHKFMVSTGKHWFRNLDMEGTLWNIFFKNKD